MSAEPIVDQADLYEDLRLTCEYDDTGKAFHDEIEGPSILQLNDLVRRIQADFANYRRRVEEERASDAQHTTAKLVFKFLAIFDNFELAMNADSEELQDLLKWKEGIVLIHRQLQTLLEAEGVSVDSPQVGDIFDAEKHEAIGAVVSPDYQDGQILGVTQQGYSMGEMIIRYPQVIVVKNS
jgi:molecular chaperone GrpE